MLKSRVASLLRYSWWRSAAMAVVRTVSSSHAVRCTHRVGTQIRGGQGLADASSLQAVIFPTIVGHQAHSPSARPSLCPFQFPSSYSVYIPIVFVCKSGVTSGREGVSGGPAPWQWGSWACLVSGARRRGARGRGGEDERFSCWRCVRVRTRSCFSANANDKTSDTGVVAALTQTINNDTNVKYK
jgi:hypothetical protein